MVVKKVVHFVLHFNWLVCFGSICIYIGILNILYVRLLIIFVPRGFILLWFMYNEVFVVKDIFIIN